MKMLLKFSEQPTSPVLDAVCNDRVLRNRQQIRAPLRFEDYAMLVTNTELATYMEIVQSSKS